MNNSNDLNDLNNLKTLVKLNNLLLDEMPQCRDSCKDFLADESSFDKQFTLFRSLVNIRQPLKASDEFIRLQDNFLGQEIARIGIIDINDFNKDKQIEVWQGNIIKLKVDAIVNAGNNQLLGCFFPCHTCIDNAIHTYAGIQLRYYCDVLMRAQGHIEPIGSAKITPAFNLPCDYIFHTVGPIIAKNQEPSEQNCIDLKKCYTSCLNLAIKQNLKSIAFCCISTGEYNFPNRKAAEIAISTIKEFNQKNNASNLKIIFNVFKDEDFKIYEKLL
ncbi:MAG: protein-ADP-ribose hydrolase [bacterium]